MSEPKRSVPVDSRSFPRTEFNLKPLGVAVTPAGSKQPEPSSFPLCQIPKSLVDQLAGACLWFWNNHHRCIGIALLLNPAERRWTAVIPTQRASTDSACWSVGRQDLPGSDPGTVLAGSIQSRLLRPDEDATDCPPPHDGIHLVLRIQPAIGVLSTFLRCDGVTREVPSCDLIFDDAEPMFTAAAGRITLV